MLPLLFLHNSVLNRSASQKLIFFTSQQGQCNMIQPCPSRLQSRTIWYTNHGWNHSISTQSEVIFLQFHNTVSYSSYGRTTVYCGQWRRVFWCCC